ncbi:MAG TPA: three-Cys-motif partner protein TcmP [Tepidisphaeraceae bacterium]|jgi:three-Cys-motif partner protein
MSVDPARVDTVGSWSVQKHQLLGGYLEARRLVMKEQAWCRDDHYIDAFAGSGNPVLNDAEELRYIAGSPRVALGLQNPFSTYTFIEMETWRVDQLKLLKSEFPERRISVVQGDCNRVIVEKVTPRIRREHFNRGFVFLDPFGVNLAWDTIAAIAETQALEIFLNFPTMGLNRAALHNDPDSLDPDKIEKMNRVWGSEDWRNRLYTRKLGLFGVHEVKIEPTSAERLARLFVEHRLSTVFPHVTDPIPMYNSYGAPIYCLIFAGHNETGARIASHILGRQSRQPIPSRPRRRTVPAGTIQLSLTG